MISLFSSGQVFNCQQDNDKNKKPEVVEVSDIKPYFSDNYPISQEIHNTTLSLPISFAHTQKEIHNLTKIMNRF